MSREQTQDKIGPSQDAIELESISSCYLMGWNFKEKGLLESVFAGIID